MGSCKANLRGQTCSSQWAWVSWCWWDRLCHKDNFCVLNPTASSQILNNVINTMNVSGRFQRRSSVLMDCCSRHPTPIMSFATTPSMLIVELESMSRNQNLVLMLAVTELMVSSTMKIQMCATNTTTVFTATPTSTTVLHH